MTPVDRAIEAAGGQTALANALGLKQGHIWYWAHRAHQIPAERVLDVERVTGIPRHELRPDLYPPPHPAAECPGEEAKRDPEAA